MLLKTSILIQGVKINLFNELKFLIEPYRIFFPYYSVYRFFHFNAISSSKREILFKRKKKVLVTIRYILFINSTNK